MCVSGVRDWRGWGWVERVGREHIVWTPAVLSVLSCMCFVFLYLHLFSAIQHVSHGRRSKSTLIIIIINFIYEVWSLRQIHSFRK